MISAQASVHEPNPNLDWDLAETRPPASIREHLRKLLRSERGSSPQSVHRFPDEPAENPGGGL